MAGERTSLLAPLLTALLLCGVSIGRAQRSETTTETFRRPVAVAALPSGRLVILESRGGLKSFDPGTRKVETLVTRFTGFLPLDISASGEDDSVFVTLSRSRSSAGTRFTRIVRVSLRGEIVSEWSGLRTGFLAGIAPDLTRARVFLTNTRSGEIAALAWADGAQATVSTFARVPRSSLLGPITFDARSGYLYAGDWATGNIHRIRLADHSHELVAERIGEPAALALDLQGTRLLVADSGNGVVWAVPTDRTGSEPLVFSDHPDLDQPQGLAVTADGRVWVVDRRSGRLVVLGPEGGFEGSYP